MSDDNRDLDSIGELEPKQLVILLEQLDPADERVASVYQVVTAIDPRKLNKAEFIRMVSALERLARRGPELDLFGMDAGNGLRLISRASRDQLDGLMRQRQLRVRILHEVFRRMEHYYRPEKAGSTTAVVHWRLTGGEGDGGYDRYESVLGDGRCRMNSEMRGDPRVTITLSPVDFMRLITRNASAPVLFMTGNLKVKGDLGFAAGLTSLFDLPKP